MSLIETVIGGHLVLISPDDLEQYERDLLFSGSAFLAIKDGIAKLVKISGVVPSAHISKVDIVWDEIDG